MDESITDLFSGKACTKCGVWKPFDDFAPYAFNRDGRASWCRKCHSRQAAERARRKYATPEGKTLHRERRLKRVYGLNDAEIDVLLEQQGGGCAICGNELRRENNVGAGRHTLVVDHCHKTGRVRGLLCGNCNAALGQFQDNPETLAKALEYLKRHT